MEEVMNPESLAWIEKQKPQLVGWAEDFVAETRLYEPTPRTAKNEPGKRTPLVRTNQLRNLLNAAQSGSPLAVLINFLRYQIGREKEGWKHRESGEALLTLLETKLREMSRGCTADRLPKGARLPDPYEMEAHLAAQLLGFIIRDYTYRCCLKGTKP
jgi:hypothetical protein